MGALSGPARPLGLNIVRGTLLALQQYNAAHPGCGVALVRADTQGDPSRAPGRAQALVADPAVLGVIGPAFSGESLASGAVFDEANLPTISPSATNPVLARQGWDAFHRLIANDVVNAPLLARYIVRTLGGTRVAVVIQDSDYGRTFARAVRTALGGRVVVSLTVRTGQTDFRRTVAAVRTKRANAVVFGGYYPEGGLLAKQLTAAGYGGKFIGGDGIMEPAFARIAGRSATQRSFMASGLTPPTRNAAFASAYQAAFGVAPGNYSAEAYDAAKVFLAGTDLGVDQRPAMLDFVNGYAASGITKKVAFNSVGDVIKPPMWIYKPAGSGFRPRSLLTWS